jgi:hypothetical protein
MQLRGDIAAGAGEGPATSVSDGWRTLEDWFREWGGAEEELELEGLDG